VLAQDLLEEEDPGHSRDGDHERGQRPVRGDPRLEITPRLLRVIRQRGQGDEEHDQTARGREEELLPAGRGRRDDDEHHDDERPQGEVQADSQVAGQRIRAKVAHVRANRR
jgi:hypothetical protein